MTLLKKRFTVSNVIDDMVELLRYTWKVVYTTNYEDALEIAAKAAHKPVEALNNTDDPDIAMPNLPIIHLHGYVQKWDIHNFHDSCVLGAESYLKLTHIKNGSTAFGVTSISLRS